jgi:acetyl esterase/lipase
LNVRYLVGSTNDRLTPVVGNADIVAARLRELGSRVVYQRAKLGAHGFGLTHKWAIPAGAWILSEI